MGKKEKILHCGVCDKFFPDTQPECPTCGNKNTHGKAFDYSLSFFISLLIFIFVGFFSYRLSIIISAVCFLSFILIFKKQYHLAEENGGYYTTNKTKKYVSKHVITSENAEHIMVAKKDYTQGLNTIDDFTYNLSIAWSDIPLNIVFSYVDSSKNLSIRDIQLEEVSINADGDIYFYGFCMDKLDRRYFRVDRISSRILYNDKRYFTDEFFSNVLFLDYYSL
ncbi:hypothetical protein GTGU_02136 [Trabulsiella guamensis ATCC 49490]|uniref:Uncharacterized protein n=1 Tax=Trabulsiella guamensis ATCC 49490 TaxID=1005994 RepID=A0A085AA52_9ENTR|nr:hypothetical protein [Trabulsiella guamensis]KFC07097.1 hypothetical protein GTGU_02136 [Trabulsiella guamensis ATCC 49490]